MPTISDLFDDQGDLTAALNNAPYVPGLLARTKLFTEKGIPTTKFFVEYQDQQLWVIPTAPRGGVAQPVNLPGRSGMAFETVHLPVSSSVLADEVLGLRAFGSTDLAAPQDLVDRKLAAIRQSLEMTLEVHRAGAIRGMVLDTDGSTLLNVFSEFGVTQNVVPLRLDVTTTDVRSQIVMAERLCEDALGGLVPTGYLVLAAPDVIDALAAHPNYMKALWPVRVGEFLESGRNGITISDTEIREYRSPSGSGVPTFIPAGEAYMIPLGIPDILITRFAPADFMAAVNKPGLPVYLQKEAMAFDKGVKLLGQSNPFSVPTRPKAIIKLLKGSS